MDAPTTQVSMILRLQNPRDAEAWDEFVLIYQPAVLKIASRLGLSDADANDACQEVMLRLSQVVNKWSPHAHDSSFRGWLYRVARNTMLQFLRNKKLPMVPLASESAGGSREELVAPLVEENGSPFDVEFLRQVLRYVAEKIEGEFDPVNWSAFWLTYAKRQEISHVAERLEISVSRVYVARSRILKRLKREVERMTESDWFTISDARPPDSQSPSQQIDQLRQRFLDKGKQ